MRLTTAYNKIAAMTGRYRIVQGGMRAGKTYAILQYLISIAEQSHNLIITVGSSSYPALRRGALRDFMHILSETGHWVYFEENKTYTTYTCKATGTVIEFVAFDDEMKGRGPGGDILFMNEANRLKFEVFKQAAMRTRLFIILDFNPSAMYWAHKEYLNSLPGNRFEAKPGNSFEILTYLDNEEIPPQIKADMESHDRNSNWWKVYGLGQIGELEGNVLKGWEFISRDELPVEKELLGYGLDFGFRPDPCALVSLWRVDDRYLAVEEWVLHELTPEQIVAKVTMSTVPNTLIVADNARPEIIRQMQQAGLQVIPCIKQEVIGTEKVGKLGQLEMMGEQQFVGCGQSLEEEYLDYRFTESKDGTFVSKVPDGKDHCIDALRYIWYWCHRQYIIQKDMANILKEYK